MSAPPIAIVSVTPITPDRAAVVPSIPIPGTGGKVRFLLLTDYLFKEHNGSYKKNIKRE